VEEVYTSGSEIEAYATSPCQSALTKHMVLPAHMLLAERFLLMTVYSHDLQFFRRVPAQQDRQINPDTLSKCLEANKKFIECLLSIHASHYRSLTNVQWCYLVHAIIILSRLSFPIERCPGWDALIAREYAPLGMFLDCLCYRMQGLSINSPVETIPKIPDGPFIFGKVLESIKKSYEQRITASDARLSNLRQGVGPTTQFNTPVATPVERLYCPMGDRDLLMYFEPLQPDPSDVSRGASGGQTSQTSPLYHDIWATMTMSWSDD
jgi:hypothetical protein